MSGIVTVCDAGCGEQFTITEFKFMNLGDGVEKAYFACPHCNREYVAFYTDEEVRKLQQKIRGIQKRFANPRADHKAAEKMEAKTKAKIKARMDELRERIEGK
ncbi:hypothetical protein [Paenibacillus apiarius]|uniref:hypothetical protein n=1 Tax=Paenibacillus apiarius TaxID=46240 RepID=UPI003B3B386F